MHPSWTCDPESPFETYSIFQSKITDNRDGSSVLANDTTNVLWRPIVFISKKLLCTGLATLFIVRRPNGTWRLNVQCMVSKDIARKWKVTIEISDFSNPEAQVLTFKGQPQSQELTYDEALETGEVMVMDDCQLRQFITNDRDKLFDYRVTFEIDPALEKNSLNLINGKFSDQPATLGNVGSVIDAVV